LLTVVIAGCGGGASVNQATTPACTTRVPAIHPADTVIVMVFESVNPSHAPVPHNREEQFVFSHLYETLVNIDCHGVVQPGLAKSWKPGSDGWLIELRDGAQFWDQTAVLADDVVKSFEPAIRAGLAITSVDPVDDHTVLVKGERTRPDIRLLALPLLAIRRPSDTPGPPVGTGAWQFDSDMPFAEGVTIEPVVPSLGPVVRFLEANPSDARDLVAGSADAMITDDPAAIDYARDRHAARNTTMTPLAWDRAYVLLSTSRSAVIDSGGHTPGLPMTVCDALAHDAVAVDARGGSTIVVRADAASTRRMRSFDDETPRGAGDPVHRVLYVNTDPTARALAERIVALAAMDTASSTGAGALVRAVPGAGPELRAAGVDAARFTTSVAAGDEFAYVLPLSWYTDFPFFLQNFQRAPWLYHGPNLAARFLPLVETRAHFVVMSDRIGYICDETGDVRVMVSGRGQRP